MAQPKRGPSAQLIGSLVVGMLVTGCSNSLWSKVGPIPRQSSIARLTFVSTSKQWQDMQCVANCDDPATRKNFEQPVWQTGTMFLGECLVSSYSYQS